MNEPLAICNLTLILVTGLVSWLGFRSREVEEKYIFEPERILAGKEFYRLITAGFLHADWRHLILNMVSLGLFGNVLELFLGKVDLLLIYFGSIIGGNLLSLYVHRHHEYRAYGASGGVCGIIFAYVLLFPGGGIHMYFIPLAIPGWLYAPGFMLLSFYGMKSARDNIGHDAHLGGAIIGLLITAVLQPWTLRANLQVFVVVLFAAILLLLYLWFNPLFLSTVAFFSRPTRSRNRPANLPRHKRESLQMDALLEKIARSGMDSLTLQEKSLLEQLSAKYKSRAESKKPESGLAI
jgi:membrane associated rhomboid family serine protease